ncbi:MAG: response regulator [Lachnospiraceae bacterium]|nr:response regulator [Lachnospiraceae bacterium]
MLFGKDSGSKSSLSTKIIIMVEIILLITSVMFCSVSVYMARVGIRKAIQQRMLDIANCASGSVNGDELASLKETDIGGDIYSDLYKTLAVFRDNVELEYVYSIKEEQDGQFIFTIDTDPVNPGGYGDAVKYTDALAKAASGQASVDEVPYSDAWGEFYSAYSPVFDSKGNVAGIIAVDFSADWFDSQLTSQMRSTVLSYAVILLLSLLVAALLSISTVRPFVKMQGQLLEEKVRAESANMAKSDFLANMSHEIRTPINAMLGMNEMILREGRKTQDSLGCDTDSMRKSLKDIISYSVDVDNAGHSLLSLVNDILDFSKIESGRMELVEAPYRLSSMLNEVFNMIMFRARDKGLEFIIDADRTLPDGLCGDEIRIRQILTNILSNAVKYTEQGFVRMTLRGERHDDGSILLTARVEDSGIGIKDEDIEKLFTRFGRLELEKNSTVEGTGLGLVITKRLLSDMGGGISVDSEYGKGSVFTVTIPQKIVNDAPMGDYSSGTDKEAEQSTGSRESFRAPSARILAVDDTKVNLTVVVSLLKNTLMQIDTAMSGAEAVAMAKETEYDVILMDQRMPEMDGTEALDRIRSTPDGKSRKSPVICLTADAVAGARERYISEGFSEYLTKPVNSYGLEKMIIRFLPEEKTERTASKEGGPVSEWEGFDALSDAGIEPRTGMRYSENDEELYRSVLVDYARAFAEKSECLKRSLADSNWNDYMIHAHSVKSTSKLIGAMTLSLQAAELEAAAKAGDKDKIAREHDPMMKMYEKVCRAIRLVLPECEMEEDDSEILEFIPKEGGT